MAKTSMKVKQQRPQKIQRFVNIQDANVVDVHMQ